MLAIQTFCYGAAAASGAGPPKRDEAMITHLPAMSLPTESTLDVTIRVTQPLNVTAFSARQRVTQYVMSELSTQLGAVRRS